MYRTVSGTTILAEEIHCLLGSFSFLTVRVISKRLSSRYISGPSRNWTKAKCANWKRINADRGEPFENYRKPEPNARERELTKKREARERMQERLHSSDLRPGIARELRKQVVILEQEIVVLEQV
jgi:hypothetical protein